MALPPALAAALLADLDTLADPAMEGRATGTPGAERARRYLEARFDALGLEPVGGSYRQPFDAPQAGVNLLAALPGADPEAGWLMVVAHHDHLGIVDGELHPGADDNASGVATLLAAAAVLAAAPRRRTVLFLSPDAEEEDQAGSRAFVAAPPVPLARIDLVVNLDMLSRGAAGELWVAGTAHFPALAAPVAAAAARSTIAVRCGHDRPDPDDDRFDWTTESDHAVFHAAGLPWLYFGVEDHDDYHTPLDSADRIDEEFFVAAAATVVDFLVALADAS